jgi:hypothetical protein
MATQPIETISAQTQHKYDANAYVLSAELEQPITAKVEQTKVTLPESGKYTYEPAEEYRLKGLISYSSGYAQVSGHHNERDGGFRTVTTAAVENLNIFDIITAERVVGQISTVHQNDNEVPQKPTVPSVTFLGTRFVNLQIAGHKVEIDRDLHILGDRPVGRKFYLDDDAVLARMASQYTRIRETAGLPDWAAEEFRWDKAGANLPREASCSLVNGIKGYPEVCFGHVIDLPHFGRIFLGELCIERVPDPNDPQYESYHFRLTMIRTELGCIGKGKVHVIALDSNGQGSGGGNGPTG